MAGETVAPLRMLARRFAQVDPDGAARVLHDVDPLASASFLAAGPPAAAAAVIERLGPDVGGEVFAALVPPVSQQVLRGLGPTVSAQLLQRLGDAERESLLESLPATDASELRAFLTYPEGSAGRSMDPRVRIYRADARAGDVVPRLRFERRRSDLAVLVADAGGRLVGAAAVADIALAPPDTRLRDLAVTTVAPVAAFASRDEVARMLDGHPVLGVPVVDLDGRPLGIIRQPDLVDIAEQDASADVQSMVGASREERALSRVSFAVRKRLPWLQINLLTAFLAASVVGLFEATIAQFTALAVLLPVVAGQSGNTGAQSLAVTMRGLALREIGLRQGLRVTLKEASVGILNGIAVSAVTMIGVYAWSGSVGLCVVIGLAMVISMAIAGVAGAAVPLALHAARQDPAQSSSIVLTTVTDVVGFFSFLGLASLFSGWL
jgi:magnesium transporter